jgi:hypothetical protein
MMEASTQPSAEDLQKAAAISGAAGAAAAGAENEADARVKAEAAIETEAANQKVPLTKEEIHELADELINRMGALGVFEPPPAPPAPTPEALSDAEHAAGLPDTPGAPVAGDAAPPRKLSWADRHFG